MTREATRREFIRDAGCMGIALAPAYQVFSMFARNKASAEGLREVDHRFYDRLRGGKTRCYVCPLKCILKPGETCFCRTRTNHDGRLYSHAYGNPCVISVDPVEKLPLHHFLPGRRTLSLAFGGCNMRCLYCQNWRQSQVRPDDLQNYDLSCDEAVEAVEGRDLDVISYAYTEPVVFSEYVKDLSTVAKGRGVKNVCASALYVNEEPLRDLCKTVDAFAVSLKGFDEKFYQQVVGSRLKPVLEAMEVLKDEGVWFEIVTLVVPTYNDDVKRVREMCRWIKRNLGANVPLHFGRFVPEYKLRDLPRTSVSALEGCRNIAREEGLRYAYIFNVFPHEGNNTCCPMCGREIITRVGLKVTGVEIRNGRCARCGETIPGIWT